MQMQNGLQLVGGNNPAMKMATGKLTKIKDALLIINAPSNNFTISAVGNYTGLLCMLRVEGTGICLFWCDTSPSLVTKTLIAGTQLAMDAVTVTANGNGSYTFTTPTNNTMTGKILTLVESPRISF